MTEVVIVSSARSAVARGKADGALAAVHPVDLSSAVMKAAIDRAGIDPEIIEDVQWGCAMPEASQGLNHARLAWLRGGFPVSTAAATINRFCSSGLQSVAYASQAIIAGQGDAVMAGGIEMMSQVPMSGYNARLSPEITESYIGMGFTAERVAKRWEITREQQDQFAYDSQRKAVAALASGVFAKEIVPITTQRYSWKGAEKTVKDVVFDVDECPRAETTVEGLNKLRPAFVPTGSVTAGNASPYSDGAAAVLMMRADKAKELGLTPIARFVSFAVAGVDPDIMGVGPIKAVPKALKRAGLTLADLKLIEFNEAFAAQALAVIKELDMPTDIINVNGGAIALGHPLGATGAKLTTQLVHELHRRGGGYGMVTMCIGGGMGAAGVFEVF
ncbi:MAG TPA: acetyl-CoA C-acyltransferase [Gemmatimonas aurantiaca]|uniref:acetyl-CoA C-acyltransferase n=2 Tax=Gemmatimonas aurantiaca TaxID=173480 RepID=C1AAK0_GEMAT|nr:thiolase family protein [Gemmatimonas aurantiaca]BAH39798.1 acetyl-CoA acetyltransferase [Gemmatimonas aurantiaca T-27]HCT58192.1 acetyl-CoA C-acyltransferase [Gemmatimonas aurantiaca]